MTVSYSFFNTISQCKYTLFFNSSKKICELDFSLNILSCKRFFVGSNFLRSACCHYVAAVFASARTKVDDIVGTFDYFGVVFYNKYPVYILLLTGCKQGSVPYRGIHCSSPGRTQCEDSLSAPSARRSSH